MPSERATTVELAETVSELLYAIAGWGIVGFGLLLGAVAAAGIVTGVAQAALGPVLLGLSFLAIAFALVALGIFVNPGMRRRLNRRHAPTEFGRVRSVDQRVIRPEEGCLERCTSCDARVEKGLVRRYLDEVAFAGLPVYTRAEGYNHYCLECAETEVLDEPDASADGADARRDRRRSNADDRLLERR